MQLKNTNHLIHALTIDWPVPNVLAFNTTRKIPRYTNTPRSILPSCSQVPFNEFNLGMHVGDDAQRVESNRQYLTSLLPKNTQIQWLEQVHGNTVYHAKEHSQQSIIADAIYTTQKNLALAIMTADCLPILLTNAKGNEIAAIHGGWKPLANDIIANTVHYFSVANEHIVAWLGPCIGPASFEVSHDVYHIFTALNNQYKKAFTQIKHAPHVKYLCDLPLIATMQLNALGITHVINQSECTVMNADTYYSYRRDEQTGRMASLICLS